HPTVAASLPPVSQPTTASLGVRSQRRPRLRPRLLQQRIQLLSPFHSPRFHTVRPITYPMRPQGQVQHPTSKRKRLRGAALQQPPKSLQGLHRTGKAQLPGLYPRSPCCLHQGLPYQVVPQEVDPDFLGQHLWCLATKDFHTQGLFNIPYIKFYVPSPMIQIGYIFSTKRRAVYQRRDDRQHPRTH